MGQWVHVPTGSTILITPSPVGTGLYPSVGADDDLTAVLDRMGDNPTGSVTVIDLLDSDEA